VWCALDGATLDAGECGVVARGLFAEVGDFDFGAVDEVMAAVGTFVCAAEGAVLPFGTSTFALDGAVVPTVALDGAVLPIGTSTFALDGAVVPTVALDGAVLPFGTSTFALDGAAVPTVALDGAVLPFGTSTFALDGAVVPTVALDGAVLPFGTSTFALDGAVVPTVALDGAVLPFGTSTFALDGAVLPFGTSTLALDGALLPLGTSTALDGATVDGFTDARGDLVEGARVRTLALGAATGFVVGAEIVARDAVSTTLLSRSSELVFTLSWSGPLNDTEDDATLLALQKAMIKRRKRVRDILRLIYEDLLAEVLINNVPSLLSMLLLLVHNSSFHLSIFYPPCWKLKTPMKTWKILIHVSFYAFYFFYKYVFQNWVVLIRWNEGLENEISTKLVRKLKTVTILIDRTFSHIKNWKLKHPQRISNMKWNKEILEKSETATNT
jgi:hypothetical protein